MWWSGDALGFDIESDGVDVEDARIITAAMVGMDGGRAGDQAELMLRPERPIPAEATKVNGITTERAEAEGMDRVEGLRLVVGALCDQLGPERPLVGHNASYDLTVLDREMRRTGIGWLETDPATGFVVLVADAAPVVGRCTFPVIDTMVLDKAVDRFRSGSRKLEDTAAHYGVPMAEGSAHGATADVIAALRITIEIARRGAMATGFGPDGFDQQLGRDVIGMYGDRKYPERVARTFAEVGRLTLAELHAAQVRWAWDQMMGPKGLKQHFIAVGKTEEAATVDGSWPLRTLADGASNVETISTELV